MTGLATDSRYFEHLPLNEVTAKVPQGEGPYLGRSAVFIRLGWCNLRCNGCDQADTWDRTRFDLDQTNPLTHVDDILDQVDRHASMVVITGGEPLIWQQTPAFLDLLGHLADVMPAVHVETNGTIGPNVPTGSLVEHFSVSPKIGPLAALADSESRRIRPGVLAAFSSLAAAGKACFKFVCATPDDVRAVYRLCVERGIRPNKVWIMPYGETSDEVLSNGRAITKTALAAGFHITTRLHILMGTR